MINNTIHFFSTPFLYVNSPLINFLFPVDNYKHADSFIIFYTAKEEAQ